MADPRKSGAIPTDQTADLVSNDKQQAGLPATGPGERAVHRGLRLILHEGGDRSADRWQRHRRELSQLLLTDSQSIAGPPPVAFVSSEGITDRASSSGRDDPIRTWR